MTIWFTYFEKVNKIKGPLDTNSERNRNKLPLYSSANFGANMDVLVLFNHCSSRPQGVGLFLEEI